MGCTPPGAHWLVLRPGPRQLQARHTPRSSRTAPGLRASRTTRGSGKQEPCVRLDVIHLAYCLGRERHASQIYVLERPVAASHAADATPGRRRPGSRGRLIRHAFVAYHGGELARTGASLTRFCCRRNRRDGGRRGQSTGARRVRVRLRTSGVHGPIRAPPSTGTTRSSGGTSTARMPSSSFRTARTPRSCLRCRSTGPRWSTWAPTAA